MPPKKKRPTSKGGPSPGCSNRRTDILVAFQDADRAAVGRELHLGQSLAYSAEQAVRVTRSRRMMRMRIRLQKSRRLVVHGSQIRARVQVKRIVAGKAYFHQSPPAFHRVNSRPDEVAVVKNVAGSRHQIHVRQPRLQDLRVATDRRELQLPRA